jgi:hypothetical protein
MFIEDAPELKARPTVKGASSTRIKAADMLHFAAFYRSESGCSAAFA